MPLPASRPAPTKFHSKVADVALSICCCSSAFWNFKIIESLVDTLCNEFILRLFGCSVVWSDCCLVAEGNFKFHWHANESNKKRCLHFGACFKCTTRGLQLLAMKTTRAVEERWRSKGGKEEQQQQQQQQPVQRSQNKQNRCALFSCCCGARRESQVAWHTADVVGLHGRLKGLRKSQQQHNNNNNNKLSHWLTRHCNSAHVCVFVV